MKTEKYSIYLVVQVYSNATHPTGEVRVLTDEELKQLQEHGYYLPDSSKILKKVGETTREKIEKSTFYPQDFSHSLLWAERKYQSYFITEKVVPCGMGRGIELGFNDKAKKYMKIWEEADPQVIDRLSLM